MVAAMAVTVTVAMIVMVMMIMMMPANGSVPLKTIFKIHLQCFIDITTEAAHYLDAV